MSKSPAIYPPTRLWHSIFICLTLTLFPFILTGLEIDEDSLGLAMTSSASAVPLSHNAALHKRAIRPRKSHAPARHRQLPQVGATKI